ncbi:MAG: hypothetical protein ACE5E5_14365 [Phycisphaerae bacterium]
MRNQKYKLVEIVPAQTPFEALLEWRSGLTGKPSHPELVDLAERLRDALVLEEDGALAGRRVVEAIDSQADRTLDWAAKSRLRFVGANVETVLREMGLL